MTSSEEGLRQPTWLRTVLIGRKPERTAARATVLVVVCLLTFTVGLRPVHIQGISMLPTYRDGGINFVNRLAYLFHEPRRGDVVAVRYSDEHIMLMKRIVGMPGETIAFHQGRILINGQPLNEPYLNHEKFPCDWEIAARKIGPNYYFVVGDNRTMPEGNHEKGLAARNRIVGRILL